MKSLIKIEWRKVLYNRIFWLTLGGYFLIMVLALWRMRYQIEVFNDTIKEGANGFIPLIPSDIYVFPHVWHNLTFIARFFKIFLGVIMVILVTNEYSYNTLRQNMIAGMSRFQLVLAKFLDAVLLSAVATLLIFVFGMIFGLLNTEPLLIADIFDKMTYLGAYFLMLAGFLSFSMMLAFLIKRPAVVLGIILIYIFIAEPILASKYDESFGNYLPIRSMNLMIELPDIPIFALFHVKPLYYGISPLHIGLTLAYTTLFFGISYLYMRRKDL